MGEENAKRMFAAMRIVPNFKKTLTLYGLKDQKLADQCG